MFEDRRRLLIDLEEEVDLSADGSGEFVPRSLAALEGARVGVTGDAGSGLVDLSEYLVR